MLGNGERGFLFRLSNNNLKEVIKYSLEQKHLFAGMIEAGRAYAKQLTLEAWSSNIFYYYSTLF